MRGGAATGTDHGLDHAVSVESLAAQEANAFHHALRGALGSHGFGHRGLLAQRCVRGFWVLASAERCGLIRAVTYSALRHAEQGRSHSLLFATLT